MKYPYSAEGKRAHEQFLKSVGAIARRNGKRRRPAARRPRADR